MAATSPAGPRRARCVDGGRRRRGLAVGGGAGIIGGAAAVTVALVAGPAPGLAGYVSEAGVASQPHASTYQVGVCLLGGGLLLLAAAVRTTLRAVAALLALAGVGIALSAAVPCTHRCPLPPFRAATPADLLHAAVSVAAVAACVVAMVVVVASRRAPAWWRQRSRWAAAAALPLSAAHAAALLLVGRGALVGVLERLLLLVVALWLLATAAGVARRPKHSR